MKTKRFKPGRLLTMAELAGVLARSYMVYVIYAEPNPMDKHHGMKGVADIKLAPGLPARISFVPSIGNADTVVANPIPDTLDDWEWGTLAIDDRPAVLEDENGNTLEVYDAVEVVKKASKNQVLGAIIDLMRKMGVKIESPYDFENWISDHAKHTQLFATGKFKHD